MKLSWYGTAAVMMESDGTRIVFDPFLGMPLHERAFDRERKSAAFRSADAVLITHGHFDHIHDVPSLYEDLDMPIYATAAPRKTLIDLGVGEEKLCLIMPGDTIDIVPFHINVYQGRHCKFDLGVVKKTVFKRETFCHPQRLIKMLRLNHAFPENEETLFYEIEVEGKRIQLMGSMGVDIDTDYPERADALILPFQGTGNPTMTVAPILAKLKPKSVYLDHYDDAFPPMSSQIDTDSFVQKLNERRIPCEALTEGKIYTI